MIEINISGFRHLQLTHLVLDYNGTLALDGHLIPQVGEKLTKLSHDLHGNGRNDGPMLKAAALGIAPVQQEGGAVETLISADIVSTSILHALDLLSDPKRLVATLRA